MILLRQTTCMTRNMPEIVIIAIMGQMNITWTKNKNLEFHASEDETGVWTIPRFAAGGSDVTYVNTSNAWTST